MAVLGLERLQLRVQHDYHQSPLGRAGVRRPEDRSFLGVPHYHDHCVPPLDHQSDLQSLSPRDPEL